VLKYDSVRVNTTHFYSSRPPEETEVAERVLTVPVGDEPPHLAVAHMEPAAAFACDCPSSRPLVLARPLVYEHEHALVVQLAVLVRLDVGSSHAPLPPGCGAPISSAAIEDWTGSVRSRSFSCPTGSHSIVHAHATFPAGSTVAYVCRETCHLTCAASNMAGCAHPRLSS
jgi:hypothetical protein